MNQNLGHVLDRETWTQTGWTRAIEPNTAEGEGSEDAITFIGVVYTRATTVDEEGDEDIDVYGAGDAGWWLPVTGYAPF
jgi:hypothetical protein